MQAIEVLCWGMMLAGAGLSGFGLLRSLARYRYFGPDGRADGEVVIGDRDLCPRQGLTVERDPGNGDAAGAAWQGSVLEITAGHLVIDIEWHVGPVVCCADQRFLRGDRISVNVNGSAAVYRFSGTIQDTLRTPSGQRIYLARPATITRLQRRRHHRVALEMPATFRAIEPGALNAAGPASHCAAGDVLHGTVRDLSGGGLRADVGGPLGLREIDSLLRTFAPARAVSVRLACDDLEGGALLGRVCSSTRAAMHGGLTVRIALEFMPMASREHEAVLRQVAGQRRKSR
ncbi:MAG TPA: PilZ domain-containing protein [Chthonomonadaceae bacterium]|nr:PilZ domain-containing protein [Chthonomonadaceae bacterium]